MLIGHAAVGAWRRRMEVLLQRFSAEERYHQWLFLGAASAGGTGGPMQRDGQPPRRPAKT
jgi:hypothetical protein